MNPVFGVLLWLFVISLGVAFGAGLYEHRIVVSRWIRSTADSRPHWDAAAARQDDTGRRFWGFVTTGPLTLLTLANLFAAWRSVGAVRGWWLAAIRLMQATDSPESAARAQRWWHLNYLRHALVLGAWLASLRAFALFYAQRG